MVLQFKIKERRWGNSMLIADVRHQFFRTYVFNDFNGVTCLQSVIYKAQSLTHKNFRLIRADVIYATNNNRNFVTKYRIKTDLSAKGSCPRVYQDEKNLKQP
ncbi:hypothetical protein ABI125_07980 [Tamlana crocina]